jgi:hypothetical protein
MRPGLWCLAVTLLASAACPGNAPRLQGVVTSGGPATHLTFTSQPKTTTVGHSLGNVTVAAQDDAGFTDTTYTGTITVTLANNPTGAILAGSTSIAAVAGVATFPNLTVDRPGSGYTLGATAPGLVGATSDTFIVLLVATAL